MGILFKSVYYNNEKIIQDEEGRFVMIIGTTGGKRFQIYTPQMKTAHTSLKILQDKWQIKEKESYSWEETLTLF